MKIIIAPARTMRVDPSALPYHDLPQFLDKTREILAWLRTLSYDELHQLWWNCSTRLAVKNYHWLQKMDLTRNLTPAIIAFSGLQYQYMAPDVLTDHGLIYLSHHLRILSGFYGLLRPFDGIVPYRLGMGDRAHVRGTNSLYEFWGAQLYKTLYRDNDVVLNLSSKEYEKAISPYLTTNNCFITCFFGEEVGGRIKQKATRLKIARGEMVRYLAENEINNLDGVKAFNVGGYRYRDEYSTTNQLIFTK